MYGSCGKAAGKWGPAASESTEYLPLPHRARQLRDVPVGAAHRSGNRLEGLALPEECDDFLVSQLSIRWDGLALGETVAQSVGVAFQMVADPDKRACLVGWRIDPPQGRRLRPVPLLGRFYVTDPTGCISGGLNQYGPPEVALRSGER